MLTRQVRDLAIAATIALSFTGSAVAAQETPRDTEVARGSLPVLAPELRVRIVPVTTLGEPLVGAVVRSSGDSIVVLRDHSWYAGFARDDLHAVQLVDGRDRKRGAATGALVGAAVSLGVLAGAIYLELSFGGDGSAATTALAVGVGGIVPVSALLGAVFAPERWRTVWEPR